MDSYIFLETISLKKFNQLKNFMRSVSERFPVGHKEDTTRVFLRCKETGKVIVFNRLLSDRTFEYIQDSLEKKDKSGRLVIEGRIKGEHLFDLIEY